MHAGWVVDEERNEISWSAIKNRFQIQMSRILSYTTLMMPQNELRRCACRRPFQVSVLRAVDEAGADVARPAMGCFDHAPY